MKWHQICSFLLLTCSVSCEIFSSTTDIVKLLDTETALILKLQSSISKVEQNILDVKRKIERYKEENQIASKNVTHFVSNPLNSFILVKRLLSEWKIVENLFSENTTQEVMRNITEIKESMTFPTEDDLDGTIDALERIRNTYNIDISSLADGKINGRQFSSQLSATDCFEIAKKLFDDGDFHSCMLWMTEALNRHDKAPDMSETSRWEILEYIAFSAFQLGDLSKALFFTDELLKIYPDHPRAPDNKAYFVKVLTNIPGTNNQKLQEDEPGNLSRNDIYKMVCRKEISPSVTITSKLKCRYVTNDIPFLRLAPMKEEELYLKPRILIFREILYDSEIEIIKNLATPKLEPAPVRYPNITADFYLKNRIGKRSLLKDEDHPVVAAVIRRVEDLTKLSTESAEELHVINYGIGGFFGPHYDYYQPSDELAKKDPGNRIVTLIFYMNDVDQGGATVFPDLRLGVWPEKGSAVFWFNLLPDGQPDIRTLHAGCPVLAGTKWIGTKWLHERGQEFKRPCELSPSNVLKKYSQQL